MTEPNAAAPVLADMQTAPEGGNAPPRLYRGQAPMTDRDVALGFTRKHATPSQLQPHEIAHIQKHAATITEEGVISGKRSDHTIRRSKVTWLRPEQGWGWLYHKLWPRITALNEEFFGFDISGFGGAMQLARYDAGDSGFYDWHMDAGKATPHRKLSISVQISDPASYEGGDLEFFHTNRMDVASKEHGALVAFPSFVMHRVTPVTKGTRLSLVAWIVGPRWR